MEPDPRNEDLMKNFNFKEFDDVDNKETELIKTITSTTTTASPSSNCIVKKSEFIDSDEEVFESNDRIVTEYTTLSNKCKLKSDTDVSGTIKIKHSEIEVVEKEEKKEQFKDTFNIGKIQLPSVNIKRLDGIKPVTDLSKIVQKPLNSNDQNKQGQQQELSKLVLTRPINLAAQPTIQAKTAQNKIFYVKILPTKLVNQVTTTTTLMTVPTTSDNSVSSDSIKCDKTSVKMASSTTTTPTIRTGLAVKPVTTPSTDTAASITSESPSVLQTVERTVNLLNNNKILIKSVKTNAVPTPTSVPATVPVHDALVSTHTATSKIDNNLKNQKAIKEEAIKNYFSSETKKSTENNKRAIEHVEIEDADDGDDDDNDGDDDDDDDEGEEEEEGEWSELDDKIAHDNKHATTPKMKREFEQLQKTVNQSKVLSEFVIAHKPRRQRRSDKMRPVTTEQNVKQTQSENEEVESNRSRSSLSRRSRSGSRSRSRNTSPPETMRSASKESDRSGTSSAGSQIKRSTRSQNTDFTAKQKRFLKGIQQHTRGSEDETDASVGDGDDEDDLDFYITNNNKNKNLVENHKDSLLLKKPQKIAASRKSVAARPEKVDILYFYF